MREAAADHKSMRSHPGEETLKHPGAGRGGGGEGEDGVGGRGGARGDEAGGGWGPYYVKAMI